MKISSQGRVTTARSRQLVSDRLGSPIPKALGLPLKRSIETLKIGLLSSTTALRAGRILLRSLVNVRRPQSCRLPGRLMHRPSARSVIFLPTE